MLPERLRMLRKNKDLTMKEFGKLFGLAETTISGYENGHREPDYETLQKFATFFKVTVDYLLGQDDSIYVVDKEKIVNLIDSVNRNRVNVVKPERLRSGKYRSKKLYTPKSNVSSEYVTNILNDFVDGNLMMIPVIDSVRPHQTIEMIYESADNKELIESELIRGYDAFILRIKDDCMNGDQIYEGDRVVVLYTPNFSPSDICVVSIGNEEATLKRVKQQGDFCIITPSNPEMEPIIYPTEDVCVIGIVVEARRRLRR